MKKRKVFLFGAGAVLDWGGPKTFELTEKIRESGFYCTDTDTDNKTTITEFIFRSLVESGYKEEDINFETIINVIEELIIYYSSFDKEKRTPSLIHVFFKSSFEKELLNFSVQGGETKREFKLKIPKEKPYVYQSSGTLENETPEQYFFQLLLADLLTIINARVSDYAIHIDEECTEIFTESNDEMNRLFSNWLRKHNANENTLRFYTLNYDRNFKVIAFKNGICDMFEGFDCDESPPIGENRRANVSRIISDFNCHCHYNLHGSIYWEPKPIGKFYNSELILQSIPHLPINLSKQPSVQIEKGKNILMTNIITGYQKAQKGFLVPFKQMQSAFDLDCINADEIYIIGYSFGDEHINMSLRTALKYNLKLKIYIVDPLYDGRGEKKGLEILQSKFRNVFSQCPNSFTVDRISDVCSAYFEGKITVYSIGMKEFLETVES